MGKLDTQFITVGTINVHYAKLGQGFPVILLHGYPETLQDWYRVAPQLVKRFTVYVVDLPGMGKTTGATEAAYSPTGMADFIMQFLDTMHVPKAHVVGHDIGVGPALALAIYHSDRVSKLAFGSGGSLGQGGPASPIQWIALHKPWGELLVHTIPKLAFKFAYIRGSGFTHLPEKEVYADLVADATSKENKLRGLAIYRTFYKENPAIMAEANKIQVPTLIFWGDKDPFAKVENAYKMEKIIPNATVKIIPGGKHFLMHDKTTELASALAKFFNP